MKLLTLSAKILLASSAVFVSLSVASFGILHRAQSELATREMDTFLENRVLSLSMLVSARPNGNFDFEMSQYFDSRFQQLKPKGFFRFIDPVRQSVLRQSSGAPELKCDSNVLATDQTLLGTGLYRVRTVQFRPDLDPDYKGAPAFEPSLLCLVVGVEEQPYRTLVTQTLASTVPLLLALMIGLMAILSVLVRRLTSDLSTLAGALSTADFGATHEFPTLPAAQTPEVRAIVDRLAHLHRQAAEVYRQMWLFLGRAAHQIKTPVAAMQTTTQVLLRRDRSKEELRAGLSDVDLAATHLSGLTHKLIASSRISYQGPLNLAAIDLRDFLADQLKLFEAKGNERGVTIQLASASSIRVLGQESLMSELFGNIIENAIQYSPIDRKTGVSISWAVLNDRAEILVKDEGIGFSDQVRASLFEPFVRGDERSVMGSGLGLFIAKKAAILLGGDVSLKRTGSGGSEMLVTLPISR